MGVAVVWWVWQWSGVTVCCADCPLLEAAEIQDRITAIGTGEGWGQCTHDYYMTSHDLT